MDNLSKKEMEERVQQILEAKGRRALEKAKKIVFGIVSSYIIPCFPEPRSI